MKKLTAQSLLSALKSILAILLKRKGDITNKAPIAFQHMSDAQLLHCLLGYTPQTSIPVLLGLAWEVREKASNDRDNESSQLLREVFTRGLADAARSAYDETYTPTIAKDLARLKLAGLEHERVIAMWLNASRQLIACETMAEGTLTSCTVYPRNFVKRAVEINAAALVIAHNHPSGGHEASAADKNMTKHLKQALAMVDVTLEDHIIVGSGGCRSMSETAEM